MRVYIHISMCIYVYICIYNISLYRHIHTHTTYTCVTHLDTQRSNCRGEYSNWAPTVRKPDVRKLLRKAKGIRAVLHTATLKKKVFWFRELQSHFAGLHITNNKTKQKKN